MTQPEIPKLLTRQSGFYDTLTSSRNNSQTSKTKYRWVWMIKNEDQLLWRVYAKSDRWFYSYMTCKQDTLQCQVQVPKCTAVRLYIEIFNNGFENVVEVLSQNDPDEEEYFASDEEEEEKHIKFRWEWKICTSADNTWRSYIKSDKWFNNFQDCKEDGRDFNFDVVCSAALKLCIQMWQYDDIILETYYDEEELFVKK